MFQVVVEYLAPLGLNVSINKCKVLGIGVPSKLKHITLGNSDILLDKHLRFLGLKITNKGTFLPWQEEFTCSMYGLKGKLVSAGLGNLPVAMV